MESIGLDPAMMSAYFMICRDGDASLFDRALPEN